MLPALLLGMIPDLVKSGVEILDRKFPSEAEKEAAVRKNVSETMDKLQDAWDKEQGELTARLQADMNSDSWLSKNIRPMVMIYLIVLFTLAFFMEVPPAVLELLQTLLMTVFVFYFGSRTLEKMTSTFVSGRKG